MEDVSGLMDTLRFCTHISLIMYSQSWRAFCGSGISVNDGSFTQNRGGRYMNIGQYRHVKLNTSAVINWEHGHGETGFVRL